MKIRNGFVSNSSSSSFLIAIHKPYETCKECGKQNIEFLDKLSEGRSYCDDNEVNQVGVDHILYEFGRSERAGWNSDYSTKMKKIVEGYKGDDEWMLADITISNHNEGLRDLLDTLVEEGRIKMLTV